MKFKDLKPGQFFRMRYGNEELGLHPGTIYVKTHGDLTEDGGDNAIDIRLDEAERMWRQEDDGEITPCAFWPTKIPGNLEVVLVEAVFRDSV